jgi:COP9 signalosome complex subunit 2
LNVEIQEVEELLIGLILEGKVEGRIDQVGMRLELDRKSVPFSESWYMCIYNTYDRQSLEKKRYAALSRWTEALESVHIAVVAKTASSGRGDTTLMPEGFGLREDRWN